MLEENDLHKGQVMFDASAKGPHSAWALQFW